MCARAESVGLPASHSADAPPGLARLRVQWIAAQVDDPPLLRVRKHLVGSGDFCEALLGGRIRIHVRVKLARELSEGSPDLIGTRVPLHTEGAVIVGGRPDVGTATGAEGTEVVEPKARF